MKKYCKYIGLVIISIISLVFFLSCNEGGKAAIKDSVNLIGTRTYPFGEDATFDIVLLGNIFSP